MNGGVDLAGRCLRCGKHVYSSGGCQDCGPYTGETSAGPWNPGVTVITTPAVPTEPEYERASGDTLCDVCKRPYYRHEWYRGLLGYDGEPFLRRICTGKIVKL
jgi:hypothetical protein